MANLAIGNILQWRDRMCYPPTFKYLISKFHNYLIFTTLPAVTKKDIIFLLYETENRNFVHYLEEVNYSKLKHESW